MTPTLSPPERLLAWYSRFRRELPWRETRDPYRIWVSEVMLQQTRVETVIPYFHGFLEKFPTLESLAAAEEADVLSSWSGLGYYRRARQLHLAARRVVEAGGRFPATSTELQDLPGIGPYTAAAIASIAFNEPIAVLDGNVERVTARLIGLEEDPKRAESRRKLLAKATDLLIGESAGESNQALMELGATVCRPARPDCGSCPLSEDCVAAASGTPERFSPRRARPAMKRISIGVMIVSRDARFLLVRSPENRRLLGGTWELPWVDMAEEETPAPARLRRRYGGIWRIQEQRARVTHSVTRWALEVCIFSAQIEAGEVAEGVEAGWYSLEEIKSIPHSSLLDKALAAYSG